MAKNKIKTIVALLFFLIGIYLLFLGDKDFKSVGDSVLASQHELEFGTWKIFSGVGCLLIGLILLLKYKGIR